MREKIVSGLRNNSFKLLSKPLLEEQRLRNGIPRTTSYLWRRLLPHAILSPEEAVSLVGKLPSDEDFINSGAKFRLSDLMRVLGDMLEHLQMSPDDFYPGDCAREVGTEGTVFISEKLQTEVISRLESWNEFGVLREWLQPQASSSDLEQGRCPMYYRMLFYVSLYLICVNFCFRFHLVTASIYIYITANYAMRHLTQVLYLHL